MEYKISIIYYMRQMDIVNIPFLFRCDVTEKSSTHIKTGRRRIFDYRNIRYIFL